jgi:hypothetical protein
MAQCRNARRWIDVHEHIRIRVKHGGRQLQAVRDLRDEAPVVVVAEEDRRLAVAAAGHMIQGVGEINA